MSGRVLLIGPESQQHIESIMYAYVFQVDDVLDYIGYDNKYGTLLPSYIEEK